ncbi:hypothetical protein G9U51_09450 [Calidifontibacter sp. DB0510]|uniref:Uncharacterized protein n=1 Tax=Metallococcus carri TaxID=1656884 RepID=A0A967B254_9MICO|nr:DUF6642 family protein [Metallococcus carri]NHN56000.1 hypothetical protein [Metallococcus carri]NOP37543.1 hypothetical protein [Calidifontibacter sp. DB2511S]
MASLPGIVCLEGSWRERLDSTDSIEPALRCIESLGYANVVHKDVATESELVHYIDQWLGRSGKAMPSYRMGMFAFHGDARTIWLGAEEVTLDRFAEIIDGRASGRVLYFGSCGVLNVADDVLTDFCRITNARGIVGYTKAVDMLETVAFEVLLIKATLRATSYKPIYAKLCREHPEWTKRLGLRMAHKTWASPRTYT